MTISSLALLRVWRWQYLAYLAFAAVIVFLLLAGLILDTHPELEQTATIEPEFQDTPHRLLRQMAQANEQNPEFRQLVLSTRDIETMVALMLARRQTDGRVRCSTHPVPGLICELSLRLIPNMPVFLNARLAMVSSSQPLASTRLRLGHLELPALWTIGFMKPVARLAEIEPYLRFSEQRVTDLRVEEDALHLTIRWNKEWLAQAENWMENLASKERDMIYYHELQKTLARSTHTRFVRLDHLVYALFGLARDRSLQDNPPIAENAAVIRVLNGYVNGGLPVFSSDMLRLQVLLRGRVDTAQHFLASAALGLWGSGEFSNILGLAKELNDTHGGSGFSFIDLAADRSGVIFARTTTASEASARLAQHVLSQGSDESVFMADIRDLPEHLDSSDFDQQFKSARSEEFTAMERLIDQRVAALAINRNTPLTWP